MTSRWAGRWFSRGVDDGEDAGAIVRRQASGLPVDQRRGVSGTVAVLQRLREQVNKERNGDLHAAYRPPGSRRAAVCQLEGSEEADSRQRPRRIRGVVAAAPVVAPRRRLWRRPAGDCGAAAIPPPAEEPKWQVMMSGAFQSYELLEHHKELEAAYSWRCADEYHSARHSVRRLTEEPVVRVGSTVRASRARSVAYRSLAKRTTTPMKMTLLWQQRPRWRQQRPRWRQLRQRCRVRC